MFLKFKLFLFLLHACVPIESIIYVQIMKTVIVTQLINLDKTSI